MNRTPVNQTTHLRYVFLSLASSVTSARSGLLFLGVSERVKSEGNNVKIELCKL